MTSCLYVGHVRHRRFVPEPHEFAYGLYLAYLDLEELPRVFERLPLASARRPAPVRFRRDDYFGDARSDLRDEVLARVHEDTGLDLNGPVRLLTHLRHFGFCFNPVSFYFCFDEHDDRPRAVLADVHNTPWGERKAYAMRWEDAKLEASHDKRLHVSPFFPMEMVYRWRMSTPGERLAIHVDTLTEGRSCFDATMTLERRPLNGRSLATSMLRFPWVTARVVQAIYWQAFRLWLKRTPFHPHPRTLKQEES